MVIVAFISFYLVAFLLCVYFFSLVILAFFIHILFFWDIFGVVDKLSCIDSCLNLRFCLDLFGLVLNCRHFRFNLSVVNLGYLRFIRI